jgi:hypothetical protein
MTPAHASLMTWSGSSRTAFRSSALFQWSGQQLYIDRVGAGVPPKNRRGRSRHRSLGIRSHSRRPSGTRRRGDECVGTVNCFEKLRCFDRVDLVFDGDENGTIAGLGLREHCGSWQVIPYIHPESCWVPATRRVNARAGTRRFPPPKREGPFPNRLVPPKRPKGRCQSPCCPEKRKEDANEHCGRHRNDSGNSREQSPKSAGEENNARRPEQASLNAR